MVRKVVMPATISVRTFVLFSLSLKTCSNICGLPRLPHEVCGHRPVQNQPLTVLFLLVLLSPRVGLSHMASPRRLDRGPKARAERPSPHEKPLIVETRSLRSALRAPVETTESSYAIALPPKEERNMKR